MGLLDWWKRKQPASHAETWEPELPLPPAGFTWQSFPEARVIVLRPEGWHVHSVVSENGFTGCVSKEHIQTEGAFETGLTVQAFWRVQETMGQPASVAAIGMYQAFANDASNQVLYADQDVQTSPYSTSFRLRFRNAPPIAKPIFVHKFCIAFDRKSALYIFTFESPEVAWDENWQKGEHIMANLVLCVDS
jgi:hypothetical protein